MLAYAMQVYRQRGHAQEILHWSELEINFAIEPWPELTGWRKVLLKKFKRLIYLAPIGLEQTTFGSYQ